MQRSTLRPLRLVGIIAHKLDIETMEEDNGSVEKNKNMNNLLPPFAGKASQPLIESSPIVLPDGEEEARLLLKRTPGSYLLNQTYGLWVFASLFLLTVIVTRKLSVQEYGVYAIAMAAFNTIAYIVALGLEDATTTFVPRLFAEHGRASAASLIRRLLLLRIGMLAVSVGIMVLAMPLLATVIAAVPIQGSAGVAAGLRDPALLKHITPIAIYVLGNGISSLITAVCASLMRMRFVFVVGSVTQLFLLGFSYVVLQLGFGTDGILWLFAIISLVNALAFTVWLLPLLFARGAIYIQPLKPVVHLGISAWLTNLVSGALLKQVSIILLGYFAVSIIQIGYFNLSFQLAHAASLLLVSGFGGVGGAALAVAFVGRNYERLARSWQALIKIETLLATPILVFCLFNAQNVAHALYGSNYDAVGPLFAIFLFFNILVRVLGSTDHQYALYVMGKPQLVVLSQWFGLVLVVILGILFIPRWGPAGALVADGLSQVLTGTMMLAFLWRALPRKYPLGFTARMLLGLVLAAIPGILWHPTNRYLLGVSGLIFFVLCIGLFVLIKPLNSEDLTMVGSLNKKVASYLQWFARAL